MRNRGESSIIQKGDKHVIRGWVMYDWANSVYQLTITTAIFPVYFLAVTRTPLSDKVSFFGFETRNDVIYSWTIASAFFVIALFSPLLSSIADYTGRRKTFMKVFTWIGALGCASLYFFTGKNLEWGVISFFLATMGYGGSIVFYNSFLPVIAEPADQDRISARGYSLGYIGGVILLLINLLMIAMPQWFFMSPGTDLPARISFLTVAVWWIGFSQITFLRLPKYTFGKRTNHSNVITNGYRELRMVFNQVKRSPRMTIFLFGYMFVMMGVLTIMFMAATFGSKEVHLSDDTLIAIVLVIQLVGILGAWSFARLSEKIGNFRAFLSSVITWIFISIGAYFITNAIHFMVAAFFIGIVMGGTQSLARSTYSKMLPETTDHTSFFSFYDVLEKLATVAGTFSFGLIHHITGSMRTAVIAIALFFIIGFIFMLILIRREKTAGEPISW